MKIILGIFGQALLKENEAYLMKYDDERTVIHLFTDAVMDKITMGKVFWLYEQLGIGGQEEIWLISDMPQYLHCVQDIFSTLFDRYMLCPCPEEAVDLPEEYELVKNCTNSEKSKILRMISGFQIIRNMSHMETYYQSERTLMKLSDDLEVLFESSRSLYSSLENNSKIIACKMIEEYAEADQSQVFTMICLSYLLRETLNSKYVEAIYQEAIKRECSVDQQLFILNQLKRLHLLHPKLNRMNLVDDLYRRILEWWIVAMKDQLSPIEQKFRNKERTVVLTLQFLGKAHSPTKTACERIYTLGKLMGREVLCINTREQYTAKGFLPFYEATIRNIVDEYSGGCRMAHKDYVYSFVQPNTEMPDIDMMRALLQSIREFAPWQIVVLGDRCLMGDLCAEMIPTVCIPMAFSSMPQKKNQYVAIGKQLSKHEKLHLMETGYEISSVIESTFTFELVEQTTKLTREELKLPTDCFLLVVVGIRLEAEVTVEFLNMLSETYSSGIHVVFAGEFENYEDYCSEYPELKEHSSFVGYQKDILALMEICDLYVNPPRIGGGFSVVEAFYKKIPGVTLNYGDVVASAGSDFSVSNLSEMKDTILKYRNDPEFYQRMSDKAEKRSKELFDSKGAMEYILNEMESRELWF